MTKLFLFMTNLFLCKTKFFLFKTRLFLFKTKFFLFMTKLFQSSQNSFYPWQNYFSHHKILFQFLDVTNGVTMWSRALHCGCALPRGINMAALFRQCAHKGNCELNCQLFVSEDGGNSASSVCFACKHLAVFHTQGTTGNSVSLASFTRPPVVEKLQPTKV